MIPHPIYPGIYLTGESRIAGFWLLDRREDARVAPTDVRCPVLVMVGSEDWATPVSVVRQVARKYRAAYREYPGRAHWLLGDTAWQLPARDICTWLKKSLKQDSDLTSL